MRIKGFTDGGSFSSTCLERNLCVYIVRVVMPVINHNHVLQCAFQLFPDSADAPSEAV